VQSKTTWRGIIHSSTYNFSNSHNLNSHNLNSRNLNSHNLNSRNLNRCNLDSRYLNSRYLNRCNLDSRYFNSRYLNSRTHHVRSYRLLHHFSSSAIEQLLCDNSSSTRCWSSSSWLPPAWPDLPIPTRRSDRCKTDGAPPVSDPCWNRRWPLRWCFRSLLCWTSSWSGSSFPGTNPKGDLGRSCSGRFRRRWSGRRQSSNQISDPVSSQEVSEVEY